VFHIIVQKGFALHVVKFWDQKGLREQLPQKLSTITGFLNFFLLFF